MTRAVHGEWTKLRTVPSTVWTALSIVVGTIAIGGFAIAGLSRPGCPEPGGACGLDTARLSLSGVYLGQVAVVVLAILAVTPEYDTGMIRTTLAADPRRHRVLAAKAVVVTAIAALAGLVGVLGSMLGARIMLPSRGYAGLSFVDGPTLRAHFGTVLYLGLIALLSMGTALVVRHTGASITVVLSLLFTLPIVAALVSDPNWQKWILRVAPMTAGLAIQATTAPDAQPIAPWPGMSVLIAYTVAAVVLGGVLFHTRDVH